MPLFDKNYITAFVRNLEIQQQRAQVAGAVHDCLTNEDSRRDTGWVLTLTELGEYVLVVANIDNFVVRKDVYRRVLDHQLAYFVTGRDATKLGPALPSLPVPHGHPSEWATSILHKMYQQFHSDAAIILSKKHRDLNEYDAVAKQIFESAQSLEHQAYALQALGVKRVEKTIVVTHYVSAVDEARPELDPRHVDLPTVLQTPPTPTETPERPDAPRQPQSYPHTKR
jgi:hypothetical protein